MMIKESLTLVEKDRGQLNRKKSARKLNCIKVNCLITVSLFSSRLYIADDESHKIPRNK